MVSAEQRPQVIQVLHLEQLKVARFGPFAIRRSELIDWTQRAKAVLPPSEPSIFAFQLLHLDSMLFAFERGAEVGEPGHLVRAASWLLDFGASCAPGISHQIRNERSAPAAKLFLRENVVALWGEALHAGIHREHVQVIDIQAKKSINADLSPAAGTKTVLAVLREGGFDPLRLPPHRNGEASPVKGYARAAAAQRGLGERQFEHAWQDLRRSCQIIIRAQE
jgi:hypothetical protein